MLQVIATDVDGDDDLDLVSSNWDSARVVWYENFLSEATPAPLQVTTPSPVPTPAETLTPAPSSMIPAANSTQTPAASSIDRTARKANQDFIEGGGDILQPVLALLKKHLVGVKEGKGPVGCSPKHKLFVDCGQRT